MPSESKQRVNGILLLYDKPTLPWEGTYADNVTENIAAFGRHSRFRVWPYNVTYGFRPGLERLDFDAIVLHYSVFIPEEDYRLGREMVEWVAAAPSYKVAFFQDEHQYCRKRFEFLNRHSIDCVYTCFAPDQHDETYGSYTKVPTVVSHVPAYVSSDMLAEADALAAPEAGRDVDVGYRARPMPPYVGRGGLEKVVIGDRFSELAAGSGLRLDISTREEDRLYGEDWYRFLGRCTGMLGTESGVSCSDLEDEVRTEYEGLVAAGEDASLERLERGSLRRWDWKVPLRTTSSRHFEAAAFRVCQIMFEGEYSGDLVPMVHYIPLKKDFSDIDEVLERFRDESVRRELTENAHRDLIASGAHSYERFIEGFDGTLRAAGLTPPSERVQGTLVRKSLKSRSPVRVGSRYLAYGWSWLRINHPGAWKTLHWASRPVVVPLRKLIELRRG